MDKLAPFLPVGADVLIVGAGPTGLVLAQLLKMNGAAKVVIAANRGIKTTLAKELQVGDEIIELDRDNADVQWKMIEENHPRGFDVVVEATGVEPVAQKAIHFVRRKGTLLVYGVYSGSALVHWPPSLIFRNEVNVKWDCSFVLLGLTDCIDNWIFCANVLFPPSHFVSRKGEDQY